MAWVRPVSIHRSPGHHARPSSALGRVERPRCCHRSEGRQTPGLRPGLRPATRAGHLVPWGRVAFPLILPRQTSSRRRGEWKAIEPRRADCLGRDTRPRALPEAHRTAEMHAGHPTIFGWRPAADGYYRVRLRGTAAGQRHPCTGGEHEHRGEELILHRRTGLATRDTRVSTRRDSSSVARLGGGYRYSSPTRLKLGDNSNRNGSGPAA